MTKAGKEEYKEGERSRGSGKEDKRTDAEENQREENRGDERSGEEREIDDFRIAFWIEEISHSPVIEFTKGGFIYFLDYVSITNGIHR